MRQSAAASPVFAGAAPIVPGDEDIDDGQEIVGELGIVVFACVRLVVNHETHAMALEDGLEQIKGESTVGWRRRGVV
jgi:hypothetical protein